MASSSAPPASALLSEQFSPESSTFPSLTLTPEIVPANTAFFHGTICMLAAMFLRRQGKLKAEDSEQFTTVMFNLFFPALLLSSILGQKDVFSSKNGSAPELRHVMLVVFVVHFIETAVGCSLAKWIANSRWVWQRVVLGGRGPAVVVPVEAVPVEALGDGYGTEDAGVGAGLGSTPGSTPGGSSEASSPGMIVHGKEVGDGDGRREHGFRFFPGAPGVVEAEEAGTVVEGWRGRDGSRSGGVVVEGGLALGTMVASSGGAVHGGSGHPRAVHGAVHGEPIGAAVIEMEDMEGASSTVTRARRSNSKDAVWSDGSSNPGVLGDDHDVMDGGPSNTLKMNEEVTSPTSTMSADVAKKRLVPNASHTSPSTHASASSSSLELLNPRSPPPSLLYHDVVMSSHEQDESSPSVVALDPSDHDEKRRRTFRGHLILNLLGASIGPSYPILLASESLTKKVFPVILVWELGGNAFQILIFNYLVASRFSPNSVSADASKSSYHLPGNAAGGSSGSSSTRYRTVVFSTAIQVRQFVFSTLSRPMVLAMTIAMLCTVLEIRCPDWLLKLFKAFAQPVKILFFFMVGLNIVWARIRQRIRLIGFILLVRILLKVFVGILVFAVFIPIWAPARSSATEEDNGAAHSTVKMGDEGAAPGASSGHAHHAPAALSFTEPLRLTLADHVLLDESGSTTSTLAPAVVPMSRSFRDVRKGILLCLCCPISSVTMGYAVEFGYDRALQAALAATSNLMSLIALWAVLVWA